MKLSASWLAAAAGTLTHAAAARAGSDDLYVVKPAPGRDVIKPMKPDWCDAGHEANSGCDENCQARTVSSAVHNDVGAGAKMDLHAVARLSCDLPDSKLAQQQVAYWRQDWVNLTGLTDKDSRDELRILVSNDAADKAKAQYCAAVKPPEMTIPAESDSFQRKRAISLALGCEGEFDLSGGGRTDDWAIDAWSDRADLPPSQIATAAAVFACAGDKPQDGIGLEAYANCAGDVARLDRKQLDAEIAALKLPSLGRLRAIELFDVARDRAARTAAEIKKNPRLQAVVDAALAAFNGWDAAVYQPHKALFDLAYAISDKVTAIDPNTFRDAPHPLGGCDDLRTGLRAYVASTKPKTRDDVLAAVTDAVGYPLLARLSACDSVEGRATSGAAELQVLRTQPRYQLGRHMAAHWAAYQVAIDSKRAVRAEAIPFDMRDTADTAINVADHAGANADWLSPLTEQTGDEGTERSHVIEQGKVAAVKKTKDGLVVTFKKESWMVPTYDCKLDGRILAFERDGTPIQARTCKVVGSHQESFQLEPRLFDQASTAGNIKPGQIVKCVSAGDKVDGASRAFLMEIDAPLGKGAPTPLEYFGVPLK